MYSYDLGGSLISKNSQPSYREEVQQLMDRGKVTNLSLNMDKIKEVIVDFRRPRSDHSSLNINGSSVKIIKNLVFKWWKTSPGPSSPAP